MAKTRSGIPVLDSVVDEAVGRGHRRDPVMAGTGGPAGNAGLTSWVGLLLLVLIAGELVTLLDVFGLMSWHVGIGLVLTVFALLKTASTDWRILRYYTGSATYRSAGPPPLRLLGPLVIATTLGVLGSGLALIAVGPAAARRPVLTVAGRSVSLVTVHAGFFVLFAVTAALHLPARFVPALSLATGRPQRPGEPSVRVPGRSGLLVAAALAPSSRSSWSCPMRRAGITNDASTKTVPRPLGAERMGSRRRGLAAARVLAVLAVLGGVGGCSAGQAATTPSVSASASPATTTSPSQAAAQLVVGELPGRLPTSLSRLVMLPSGDHLLLLGGLDAANHTSADVMTLSPATGVTTQVGRLPQATHDAGGAVLAGRALVVGGGVVASTADVQATAPDGTGATVAGRLPQPRSDLAVAADATTAYVVGGYTGSTELPDVLATTDGSTFRVVAHLAEPVRYPAAVLEGQVLWVLGGEHDGTATDDIQRIDLTTGAVTVAGHLPAPLAHSAATVLGGSILLIGGADGNAHEATVYRFTPATASVTAVGALPTPTSDAAVAVLAGSAYVVGGETSDVAGKVSTLDTVVRLRFSR